MNNNYWIKVICVLLSVQFSIQSTLTTVTPPKLPVPPTLLPSSQSTLSPLLSKRLTSNTKPTYAAGVVEFAPEEKIQNLQAQLAINLQKYKDIIHSDEARELEIIVFPEYTLNSHETPAVIPPPNQNFRACGNSSYSTVTQELSCAAARVRKYVVISLIVKRNCSEESELVNSTCAANGFNLYNAAIVFDREGIVIALYRKYNLFGDTYIKQPIHADHTTFTTDFGVTFGLIICFDIVLKVPAVDLIDRGIQNFIMPTMWYSELPFDTAVQYQQYWAHAHNVNLIAAGGSSPEDGYTGTGIYSGHHGALNATVSGVPITKLLTAEVPKVPQRMSTTTAAAIQKAPKSGNVFAFQPSEIFSVQNLRHLQIRMLNFSENVKQKDKVCQNDFCCNYEIEVSIHKLPENASFYSYGIAVLNGSLSFLPHANVNIYSTICSLVACSNETMCEFNFNGTRFEKYVFKQIHIYAKFPSNRYTKVAPNTLTTQMLPLQPNDYLYSESAEHLSDNIQKLPIKSISLQLSALRSDILTFSIYSRDYSKDVVSSVSQIVVASNLLFSIVLALIFSSGI